MIYTITTNPSLDYYLKLKDLKVGSLNRSYEETYDAAGKGVNVSKFLDKLNIRSVALGFLGGFNKEFYISLLSDYVNIQPQFTRIEDNTRINIKLMAKETTSLNALGPKITDDEFNKFKVRMNQIYDNDFVIMSGNVQKDLADKMCDVIKDLIDNNVKVILDTDDYITSKVSAYKPFLVKMDNNDIGTSKEEIVKTGKEYIEKGAQYFLFSSAHTKSYLFDSTGYYVCENTKDLQIGSNDGMIAGILWSKLKGANPLEFFGYGNAIAGGVSMLDEDVDFDQIEKIYKDLKIERIDF